jgi:hypothetical protein
VSLFLLVIDIETCATERWVIKSIDSTFKTLRFRFAQTTQSHTKGIWRSVLSDASHHISRIEWIYIDLIILFYGRCPRLVETCARCAETCTTTQSFFDDSIRKRLIVVFSGNYTYPCFWNQHSALSDCLAVRTLLPLKCSNKAGTDQEIAG